MQMKVVESSNGSEDGIIGSGRVLSEAEKAKVNFLAADVGISPAFVEEILYDKPFYGPDEMQKDIELEIHKSFGP